MLPSRALTAAFARAQNRASPALCEYRNVVIQTYDDLKRYLEFDARDEALLVEAVPVLEDKLSAIAELFYARVLEHAAIFKSDAQIVRQKKTLCDFLRRFFSEPRDPAYLAGLNQLGKVHVEIGLPQRYVVAGMNVLRAELGRSVEASGLANAASIRRAIDKGLDLDLAVLVEGYAAAEVERAKEFERRESAERTKRLAATGILAAGLAHEIRNPLNGAQLHLVFLRRRVEQLGAGGDVLDAVDVATNEVKRVATLLTELLSFAAPTPPQVALADLREVCRSAASAVASEAAKAGIQIDVTLPPAALEAWVDVPRLVEVLAGVLRNGFEAISSAASTAAGVVRLRALRTADGLAIEVEDNGPGIASSDAPIFEPFFTTKPNGSGLGLSIAHRLLTDHGGALTFSSASGRTIFKLKFPEQGSEPAR